MFIAAATPGQLLRHKYGGFYRFVCHADGFQAVLKHVWPFPEANQTREWVEIDTKFLPVDEEDLSDWMTSSTTEEFQAMIAKNKQLGRSIFDR